MTPPATPRFEAPIQRREDVPTPQPPRAAAADDVPAVPVVPGEVEIVGAVDPHRDRAPGWNTAVLLDALVEMHNPMMEIRDGSG
jgi:hypothetical protein